MHTPLVWVCQSASVLALGHGLLPRLRECKPTSPGAGPGVPLPPEPCPPLTSQQGFSSPRASGGPSIPLARPPGLPGGWHSGLGDGRDAGHGGVLGTGVCWERLVLTGPTAGPLGACRAA